MRLCNIAPVTALALGASPFASAYANPEPCSGVCVNAHDPGLIRRDDGTYFRFSTGGKIAIHSAPAIEGPWKYECAMLPDGSSIQLAGNDDLWAPDVAKVGDEYYVYYTVSTFGVQNSAIGLATSPTMDCGSFKDLGTTGVESRAGDEYNAIDGNLLRDGNTWRFSFGSFYSGLYSTDMQDPPTKSSGTDRQLAFVPAGEHAQEAPFMVKNGEFYYLFFSVGKCCGYDASRPAANEEYKIKVCRSSSATEGFVSKRHHHNHRSVSCVLFLTPSPGRRRRHLLHRRRRYHRSRISQQRLRSRWTGRLQRSHRGLGALLPLRRHQHWLRRWRQAVRLEQDRLEQRLAQCVKSC